MLYFRHKGINSFKYLRSTTLVCKDIGIRKLELLAKSQFLSIGSFKMCRKIQLMDRRYNLNKKRVWVKSLEKMSYDLDHPV